MNMLSKIDMARATQLTREGRLTEAMAVLKGEGNEGTPAEVNNSSSASKLKSSGDRAAADSGPPHVPPMLKGVLEKIKTLGVAEGLKRLAGSGPDRAPTVPDGARFETRHFASDIGSRDYKIYVPSGYHGQAVPLVVMLHGCTQSPDDFAAGTRMNDVGEEQIVLVAYPAQDKSANTSKCWNWFRAGDQHRDAGEPALIAGITRQIIADFSVQPGRVYVAGLSAGGAAAAIMGQTYPELYAAVGVHSGLACGAALDVASAFTAMRQGGTSAAIAKGRAVPTIVFHGDRDGTVNPINGDQVIAQVIAPGLQQAVDHGEAPGGMAFTRTVQVDAADRPVSEQWVLHGAGHAWSGGSSKGSYTEPRGPDASRAMMRFFNQHAVSQGASGR